MMCLMCCGCDEPADGAQRLEPLATFLTNGGEVASSYLLYTYEPGTTTAKATYKEVALTNAHTNPVILNYAGRPAGDVPMFFTGSIKYVLKTADGGLIYSVDNYSGSGALADNVYYYLSSYDDLDAARDAVNALAGDPDVTLL